MNSLNIYIYISVVQIVFSQLFADSGSGDRKAERGTSDFHPVSLKKNTKRSQEIPEIVDERENMEDNKWVCLKIVFP